jgi:serine/threonine protein phosphatase PrpC/CRP-like cAMP-binding protein
MGCCESVEDSSYISAGKPQEEAAQPEAAMRKVVASDEAKEIICGGLRLRYAFLSQKGYYPDDLDKQNQDAYSITERFGGPSSNDALFAVYDGHGKDGDLCAQFARDRMPSHWMKHLNKSKEKEAKVHAQELERLTKRKTADVDPLMHIELPKQQFQQAALKAHVECNAAMHADSAIDDSLSGTTAISVYFHGRRNRITICNVGDSRAIIGKQSGRSLKAFPLSRDQTPYRRDERARIRATGARILSLDQIDGLEPINDHEDSSNNDDDLELGEELDEGGDPPRVWSPNGDYPGTAFTRSLGDAMAEDLGVFAEPEMLTREIKAEDRVIVIASDGIYEFLTNQSVVDICAKFSDPLEACRAVVAESYELWLQYELRTDDITIIVIYVDTLLEASMMQREYVTSSFRDLRASNQSEDAADEDEALASAVLRPVRTRMTKEKAQEIEKLKQKAYDNEEDLEELTKEVDLEKMYTEKTASEKARIADAIKTSVMFRNITDEQRELIFGVMEHISVKAGEWVIKQGSVGDRFYIIDDGNFEVRIVGEGETDDGTGGKLVHVYEGSVSKHLHPCFGELALMYSAPRSASIVARTNGQLWGLHRSAFRQVLAQAQGTRKDLGKTLRAMKMFRGMKEEEIRKLAAAYDEVAFGRGDSIVEQGSVGDAMFVITSGSCGKCDGRHNMLICGPLGSLTPPRLQNW